MTSDPTNSVNILLDFEALPTEAIALEPRLIDQAVQLSSQSRNEAQQWQTYLNALALFSFEQWLNERAAELPVSREHCSVFQPPYADVIGGVVCNLRVGEFNLCLIAMGSLTDEAVNLPRAVIDLPEFTAHFYVVLEILEEQEQAKVWGFVRYDQLIQRRQSVHLQAQPDWTYVLPLAWFDCEPERLLLYLRCLDPAAIVLPEVPANRRVTLANMPAELAALLPRLQSADDLLWQVLTWEQGVAVIANPELPGCLYQLRTEDAASLTRRFKEVSQLLTQPAINVGMWLRGELDEIAQSLSWVLLPSFTSAPAPLRSPVEEIDTILTQLRRVGRTISPQARSGYKDLTLVQIPLRLYVVTWSLCSPENAPEWTLLLILGAQFGQILPNGIELNVSDQDRVLVKRRLDRNTDDSTYLYARVSGTWDEKFLVTIALGNGAALTLPPFAFHPD